MISGIRSAGLCNITYVFIFNPFKLNKTCFLSLFLNFVQYSLGQISLKMSYLSIVGTVVIKSLCHQLSCKIIPDTWYLFYFRSFVLKIILQLKTYSLPTTLAMIATFSEYCVPDVWGTDFSYLEPDFYLRNGKIEFIR